MNVYVCTFGVISNIEIHFIIVGTKRSFIYIGVPAYINSIGIFLFWEWMCPKYISTFYTRTRPILFLFV